MVTKLEGCERHELKRLVREGGVSRTKSSQQHGGCRNSFSDEGPCPLVLEVESLKVGEAPQKLGGTAVVRANMNRGLVQQRRLGQ